MSATVLASQAKQEPEQQPEAPQETVAAAAAAEEESKPAPVHYKIVVCTSDQRGAGTDANVKCILYGPEGEHKPHASVSQVQCRNHATLCTHPQAHPRL